MGAGRTSLKVAGVAAGVAVGAAGAVIGAERAVVRSLRHRADPDAGHLGPLVFDEARRLPGHDGGSIYTVSRGAGPTFVLSHGVTISSHVWVKQFATLPDDGVRVVAFDHRGHGESLAGDTGHSIANLADDVRTVLEGLDLRDVVFVGHSMGGVAAQAFVLRYPEIARERLRGLVLLSTFSRTPLKAARPLLGTAERITGWLDLAALMRRPELGTFLARFGFGRAPLASQVELTRQMFAACDPDVARDAIVPLLGLDLTSQVHRLALPALVLSGTADVLAPSAESRRIAEHLPDARLVLLEGAGHMVMLERAEELRTLLLDFARELGLAVPGAGPGAASRVPDADTAR